MLRMPVHQGALDHPIPCSICNGNADVILFEKIAAPKLGAIALKKKDARCSTHADA